LIIALLGLEAYWWFWGFQISSHESRLRHMAFRKKMPSSVLAGSLLLYHNYNYLFCPIGAPLSKSIIKCLVNNSIIMLAFPAYGLQQTLFESIQVHVFHILTYYYKQ
jgi:hypothetical protein